MNGLSEFVVGEIRDKKYLKKYTGTDTDVVIPSGITWIGEFAFYDKKLTSLVIPSTVTQIDDGAFYLQNKMQKVVIPDSVEEMFIDTFGDCTGLTEVCVSDRFIEKMWRYCHADLKRGICCTYLRNKENFSAESEKRLIAFIKKDKKYILQRIFVSGEVCVMQEFLMLDKKLTPVMLDEYISECKENAKLTEFLLKYKDEHFSEKQLADAMQEETEKQQGIRPLSVADWRRIFKFQLKNGKAVISGYKEDDSEIRIPGKIGDNIVVVGKEAFDNKRLLKKVVVEAGVEEISEYAFCSCVDITDIYIEEGLKKICFGAFAACLELKYIFIPASVQEIERNVFSVCKKVEIHTPKGSYAETYAKENNIPFVTE